MAGYTAREINEILAGKGIYADKVFKSKGSVKARFGFFYRSGKDEHYWAQKIKDAFEGDSRYNLNLVNAKEIWQAWPKDSYWEVIFTIN